MKIQYLYGIGVAFEIMNTVNIAIIFAIVQIVDSREFESMKGYVIRFAHHHFIIQPIRSASRSLQLYQIGAVLFVRRRLWDVKLY